MAEKIAVLVDETTLYFLSKFQKRTRETKCFPAAEELKPRSFREQRPVELAETKNFD